MAKNKKNTKEKWNSFFNEEETPNIEERVIEETPEPEVDEIIPEPVVEEKKEVIEEPEVEEIIPEPVVEEKIKEEVKPVGQADSRMMRRMGK